MEITPKIVIVDDYHKFYWIAAHGTMILDQRVKFTELGFDGHDYVGLIYQGKKPSNKVIKELLKSKKIVLKE